MFEEIDTFLLGIFVLTVGAALIWFLVMLAMAIFFLMFLS